MKKTSIGGQALLEGIMMRGPKVTAMAVRNPKGEIVLEEEPTRGQTRPKICRLPIIRGVFGVQLDDKKSMVVARVTVLCVAVCGVLFALDPTSSIFRVVSFAWAGFGATFGPIVLFSLYWKRCNKWGAIAGMFSGAAMVFIWKYAIAPIGGAFAIYELLPAFVTSCIFIVVVSLLTKAPDAKICEDFDAVAAMK